MNLQPKIRVLLADDHALVRDGLRRVIDEQEDMEVVAEAGDGPDALRLSASVRPDVALVDVSMPGWDGATIARKINAQSPEVRIVAVTRHDEGDFVRRMLDAGASGYVLKQSPSKILVEAIRTVRWGGQYIDPTLQRTTNVPATTRPTSPEGGALTPDEEAILRLVAFSWSNLRIAERLGIMPDEVFALKSAAMRKAGLLTRIDVLNYVAIRGWSEVV